MLFHSIGPEHMGNGKMKGPPPDSLEGALMNGVCWEGRWTLEGGALPARLAVTGTTSEASLCPGHPYGRKGLQLLGSAGADGAEQWEGSHSTWARNLSLLRPL